MSGLAGSMAPWEVTTYFDMPKVNLIPCTATIVPLAVGNPNRVGLIIDRSSGTTAQISISDQVANTNGIVSFDNRDPLFLTFADWGPLVQAPWFGFCSGATVFTVIELILNRWPGDG